MFDFLHVIYVVVSAQTARRLWKDYFTTDVSAVVFIVDDADPTRFGEAKRELDVRLSIAFVNEQKIPPWTGTRRGCVCLRHEIGATTTLTR